MYRRSSLSVPAALLGLALAAAACGPSVEPPTGIAFGGEEQDAPAPLARSISADLDPALVPAAPGGAAPRSEIDGDAEVVRQPPIHAAISHDAARLVGDLLPTLRIEGGENTDSGAIELVLMGKVQLAVVARPVSDNERKSGVQEHVLGWHVPVLVVHMNNPLRSLSRIELREVLAGKIQSWARLGGPLAKINLLAPPQGAESDHFAALMMPGDRVAKTATTVTSVRDRLAMVASDPNAVTFASLVDAQRRTDVRTLAITMVAPSANALAQGRYPVGCAVRLVWKKRDERIEGLLGETRCEPWLSRVAPRLLP